MTQEPPKLLDRVRAEIRTRHYSRRTEEAYVHWIRRYILFHGKRHPMDLGAAHITAFLTSLATVASVAASTQNQAFSAVMFLYRDVLHRELGDIEHAPRERTPLRVPVVLSVDEVRRVLALMRVRLNSRPTSRGLAPNRKSDRNSKSVLTVRWAASIFATRD